MSAQRGPTVLLARLISTRHGRAVRGLVAGGDVRSLDLGEPQSHRSPAPGSLSLDHAPDGHFVTALTRLAVAAVAAVLAVVSGCSTGSQPVNPVLIELTGVLHISRYPDCVWIAPEGTHETTAVTWTDQTRVDFVRAELKTRGGTVRAGRLITVQSLGATNGAIACRPAATHAIRARFISAPPSGTSN